VPLFLGKDKLFFLNAIQKIILLIEFINNANWEFIVAIFAIITSVFAIYTQRAHNKLTFKPIPIIQKYNYNNRIKILLWNKGTGPLFIKSFIIKDKNDNIIKVAHGLSDENAHGFMDLVPVETRKLLFVEFINDPTGRVIAPAESLNMIEFKIRDDDSNNTETDYNKALEKIKTSLDRVVVHIMYSNIYKNKNIYVSQKLIFDNLVNEEQSVRKIKETLIERENKNKIIPPKKTNIFKNIFGFKK
jgi:hypothetical protein